MRFFIRADASIAIGTGHIYRCLSLADDLLANGYGVTFVCRRFEGHLIELIQQRGFEVVVLPSALPEGEEDLSLPRLKHADWLAASQAQDAQATLDALRPFGLKQDDWVLVDHFALDARWETRIQSKTGCQVAVIDGQADRRHDCQVLIDPNVCAQPAKWRDWLPADTLICQGWSTLPIGLPFRRAQPKASVRAQLTRILVAFGGVDADNFTQRAVDVLLSMRDQFDLDWHLDVVVGKHYPYFGQLNRTLAVQKRVRLYCQSDEMATLMCHADLAIGAGGTMAWERAWLYLPTLVTSTADNQQQQVACLVQLALADEIVATPENYGQALFRAMQALRQDPQRLQRLSQRAKNAVQNKVLGNWSAVFQVQKKGKRHD